MTASAPPRPDQQAAADVELVDRWWRAANYLAAGQIYLSDNALLREPLLAEHIKPRLLGHWGTTPGLNFVWAHATRVVRDRELDAVFIAGPGHGGPAMVANAWLDGTWTRTYPDVGQDLEGMRTLMRQFSFPGGIPSHAAAEVPGSMHEGGELGYSLAHAFGAVFDNPDLTAFCVVGDGEAETGPLAASWHSVSFLDPVRDGAVVPVLHLNGWKIANPTVLSRIPPAQLDSLLRGYGYEPVVVEGPLEGEDALAVHRRMAAAMDAALDRVAQIKGAGVLAADGGAPTWPVIVLRTPKGWTGPRFHDGAAVEGTYRAHQVPLSGVREDEAARAELVQWLVSYGPDELFTADGAPDPGLANLLPRERPSLAASPHANGGLLVQPLDLPAWAEHAVEVADRGGDPVSATEVLGRWLGEVIGSNRGRFRLFGPDEVSSNKLDAVFEQTGRVWQEEMSADDSHAVRHGAVMEVLSEHLCQGWLEGYLLTGRHGLFTSYEAFIHIIDSMLNQHAKWLKVSAGLSWRPPLPSLNYLLSSHVWRQDHNGFSHQDPGFLGHVANKKPEVSRIYLPPDANSLLAVMDRCLGSRHRVNVVVAGKHPTPGYLGAQEAADHLEAGVGVWPWASTVAEGEHPEVVLACAGDVPTAEALAAADYLRHHAPGLRLRFVNVVDLMRLLPEEDHPHGLPDASFDAIFGTDVPVVFAWHGYPSLVHQLTYRRHGHAHWHVHGYAEEGSTTTPFDMVVLNGMDRFTLAQDVLERVDDGDWRFAGLREDLVRRRDGAQRHTRVHGEDHPDVTGWRWRDAVEGEG